MILGIVQKIILSSKNIFKYLNLWFFKRWICVGVLWFQTARQGSHALLMSTMWNIFFYIQQFVKVESSDDLCWCQPCGAFSLIYDCLSRFPRSNDLQLMEIGRKIHTTQTLNWHHNQQSKCLQSWRCQDCQCEIKGATCRLSLTKQKLATHLGGVYNCTS